MTQGVSQLCVDVTVNLVKGRFPICPRGNVIDMLTNLLVPSRARAPGSSFPLIKHSLAALKPDQDREPEDVLPFSTGGRRPWIASRALENASYESILATHSLRLGWIQSPTTPKKYRTPSSSREYWGHRTGSGVGVGKELNQNERLGDLY